MSKGAASTGGCVAGRPCRRRLRVQRAKILIQRMGFCVPEVLPHVVCGEERQHVGEKIRRSCR